MKIKLKYPIEVFKVRSTSEPNTFHEVLLYSDGSLNCDCIAGSFSKECKHKIKVHKFIDKRDGRKR